jgi:hypothetical protein
MEHQISSLKLKGEIKVHESRHEKLNLDCVHFCKVSGFEHLLLCAKYEQNQETYLHSGGIILYDTQSKYTVLVI